MANLGEKYTHRITLRVNDAQYEFLLKLSNLMDISPSDYLRMVINSAMVASSKKIEQMCNGMVGMDINENVETNSNNIV